MKQYVFLLITIAGIFHYTGGMEDQPKPEFVLQAPVLNTVFDIAEFKIRAVLINNPEDCIGSIGYMRHNAYNGLNQWQINNICVSLEHRNKGIGLQLFKKCIEEIKKQSGTQLTWKILPFGAQPPSESELIDIYMRMLRKVDPTLAKSAIIKEFTAGNSSSFRFYVPLQQYY